MFARVVTALALASLAPASAVAEEGICHVVDVQLQPQKRTDLRPGKQLPPQIVVWVEDAAGTFIDTVFITQQTGTYGLGNRPGRMDFNSAPLWPYGKRTTTFPVWADKKPERFDAIVFQDGAENNLSHRVEESSLDPHYCRPMQPTGPDGVKFDAMTCASPATTHTDKGIRSNTVQSKYPPRQDMVRAPEDAVDIDTFPDMNPYDAVSGATPPVNQLARFNWPILGRPPGDYVMWVEVSTEFDHNATYTVARFPSPNVSYSEYGEAYRGQPSVVFRVPFTIATDEQLFQTATYHGYGDPEGVDGTIRPPDATISESLMGSGLQRLALVTDEHGEFRVRVTTRPELDFVKPNAPSALAASVLGSRRATLTFLAPGDDAVAGTVRGYEIRYRVGSPVTEENFDASDSIVVPSAITPAVAGTLHELVLDGLLPETDYHVGIRAFDDCRSTGPIATLAITTTARVSGEVDACFVATAAYGTALAADVSALRDVRDSVLRKTVLGELFVQAYYTFGPPVAGVVGESELLRATARAALVPVVDFARRHVPSR
jgi:hypothetical protein